MKLAQDIIIKPVITEKSMDALAEGKYTFKVAKDSNKAEIARAVEELFNVQVVKINTLNVRGRSKRVGRFTGKTASWKKAIVKISDNPTKPGIDGKKRKTSIEFFEGLI
jgi:large subunit ribosomal protein L23